jgi:hypothetical protein
LTSGFFNRTFFNRTFDDLLRVVVGLYFSKFLIISQIGVTKALNAFLEVGVAEISDIKDEPWIGTNPIQHKLIEKIHYFSNYFNYKPHESND